MATISKSSIILTSIADAYSISASPDQHIVRADYDGSHPDLGNASTALSLYCGETRIPMTVNTGGITVSDPGIVYAYERVDDYRAAIKITSLPVTLTEGWLEIPVSSGTGYEGRAKVSVTVVRESTMLDWIQDWEGDKTTIGGTSIITPRLFVGKKLTGDHGSLWEEDGLTGTYIGPAPNDSCGIYGYKGGREIFHIDQDGGSIGGWDINVDNINSKDGRLLIESAGHIRSIDGDANTIWEVNSDGTATFARGNVRFEADGSAEYKGKITAASGAIGGWEIGDTTLNNFQIEANSAKRYFAIANITFIPTDGGNRLSWAKQYGGVAMHYTSSLDYGFIAYRGSEMTFSAGSENFIAGWRYDKAALWIGTKNNNTGEYTADGSSVTIGTNGLRGNTWYIDKEGEASFAHGAIRLSATSGKLASWTFDLEGMYLGTKNTTAGEYTTKEGDVTLSASGIRGFKWRLESKGSGALAGGNISWDTNGNVTFSESVSLSWTKGIGEAAAAAAKAQKEAAKATGILNNIASDSIITTQEKVILKRVWDNVVATHTQLTDEADKYGVDSTAYNTAYNNIKAIVEPILSATSDSTVSSAYMEKWQTYYTAESSLYSAIVTAAKALTDGAQQSANTADAKAVAAAAAAAKAQTTADGANTKYTDMLGTYLTYIGSNGIYTGQLVADQIVSGTISTADIKSTNDKWHLYNNGSGKLAGGNISWDTNGNVTFSNSVSLSWTSGISEAKKAASDAQSTANSALSSATSANNKYTNLIGTYLTYIDANGIYTGTLAAEQVNALTCTFSKGTIGGWDIGADYITNNDIYLGSNGDIYCRYGGQDYWRINNAGKASFGKGTSVFNSNGSGSLAGGSISWDASGNVTLSDKCSISFDATSAVEGVIGNKLTNITSDGIYTGSLSASQVNALTCTFSKGTIGGWSVAASKLSTTGVGYASLEVNIRSDYFLKINNSDMSGLLAVRADNGIGIAVQVSTTSTVSVCQGLNISCLNTGKGRCIEAVGNSRFEARVGEQVQLLGVALRTHFISSSSDSIKANDDIVVFRSGAKGSYALPSPSLCTGKILFVKNKGGSPTSITGTCTNCNNDGSHSSSTHVASGSSLIYVCDGSSWIQYYCG